MRFIKSFALLVTLLSVLAVSAQTTQPPVLKVQPFVGAEADRADLAALQNLVTSYVVELKRFRVLDAAGQERALAEAETAIALGASTDIALITADYILGASLQSPGGVLVFTLDIVKVSTGEKRSVSETIVDRADLVLAARRLTRRLFGLEEAVATSPPAASAPAGASGSPPVETASPSSSLPPAETASPTVNPTPRLADLAGTWKGDKGVEKINFFPDGRGLVLLSSGASMRVEVRVNGSRIEVLQTQPNKPEFYRGPGIDYAAAKVVAAKARPWKWVFNLSMDGKSLFGVKESVFVRIEGKDRISVDNNYVRDALWLRLSR